MTLSNRLHHYNFNKAFYLYQNAIYFYVLFAVYYLYNSQFPGYFIPKLQILSMLSLSASIFPYRYNASISDFYIPYR